MFRTAVIVVCLATIGFCDICTEENNTVTCGENFQFPLVNVSSDIEKLVVHSHLLTTIAEEDLTEYPELRVVDFSNSGLKTIHQNAFAGNPNLEEVNLSNNVDLKLAADAPIFASQSVKTLNLESTGITDLTDLVFSDLPNLSTLNLAGNEINYIEKALENAKQIETLIIMKDSNLDRDILCQSTSLTQIKSMYFDDNDTEIFDTYSCNDAAKVKVEKPEEEIEEPKIEVDAIAPVEESHTEHEEKTELPKEDEEKTKEDAEKPKEDAEKPVEDAEKPNEEKPVDEKTEEPKPEEESPPKVQTLDEPKPDAIETEEKTEPKTEEPKNVDAPPVTEIKYNEIGDGDVKVDGTLQDGVKKDGRMLMPSPNAEGNEIEQSVGESKSTNDSVSGSTLVLGIIVVVLVIGALGIGYKYWKNHRGYHNTRTDDVEEGKEMKTIATNNKTLIEQNE